jgi:hypothetical protein
MNPYEYLDLLKRKTIKELKEDNKTRYSKNEVIELLKKSNLEYKKAIYNGEYIFNIESLDNNIVKINDNEFSVKKLITHDNKYLLFVQITNITDDNFTETDLEILGEQINKAITKANNIAGVLILPPNMDISLITAKLDTLSYAKSLGYTQQDIDMINTFKSELYNNYSYTISTNSTSNGFNINCTSYYPHVR